MLRAWSIGEVLDDLMPWLEQAGGGEAMQLLADEGIVTDEERVPVGKATLLRALAKARRLYVRVAEEAGLDPGPEDECWAEFEALAAYVKAAS